MRVGFNPAAEPGNVPGEEDLPPWPLAGFTRAGWLREACRIGDCISRIGQTQESTIHLVRQAVRKVEKIILESASEKVAGKRVVRARC